MENGVRIDNYVTREAKVKLIEQNENTATMEIVIHEGKNRQVRKMCEKIGKEVIKLHRSKIGNIAVKDLKLGEWRYLESEEVKAYLKTKIRQI